MHLAELQVREPCFFRQNESESMSSRGIDYSPHTVDHRTRSADFTPYHEYGVDCLVRAVRDLKRSVERMGGTDTQLLALLDRDASISYRQRAIINQALKNPQDQFVISQHRRNYGVAYATARADLMKLAEPGFFGAGDARKGAGVLPEPQP